MSELHNRRRQQAQSDLGLDNKREQEQIERAMQKEEERREKKLARQIEIEESMSYRATQAIAKYMDQYFLDPIIGFFVPGFGDVLTSVLVLPFIYVSLFKIRSLPLTLAVIFNVLKDMAFGLIPVVGDLVDAINRGYRQNCRLIVGFVEDDKEIISKVNRKAFWMLVLIVVFALVIYLLVGWAIKVGQAVVGFFIGLF